jgi:hypothetical protein
MPLKLPVGERAKPEFRKHINAGLSTRIFINPTYMYLGQAHFCDLTTKWNIQCVIYQELYTERSVTQSAKDVRYGNASRYAFHMLPSTVRSRYL